MSNIIYYADENADELKIFEQAAATMGNTIETFENGDELMIAVDNSPPVPKMVFVDLNKTKDSFKVVEEIRQSKNSKIPIVIVSGNNNFKIIQKFKELGASLFIPKCKSKIKLKAAIEFALQRNWRTAKINTKNFYFNSWL